MFSTSLSVIASFLVQGGYSLIQSTNENRRGSDIVKGHLLIDDLPSWSLRGRANDGYGDLNNYIRISVLSLIVLCVLLLMYLIIYGVNRWVSPTIFHDKRKLRYMFLASIHGTQKGRNRTCIIENGCSGGSMNKCEHAYCS